MPRKHQPVKHTPFKPDVPCSRKRRFKSESEALRAIEQAGIFDINVELRTYQCPYCSGWHL